MIGFGPYLQQADAYLGRLEDFRRRKPKLFGDIVLVFSAVVLFLFIHLTQLYLYISHQFVVGWGALALILLLKWFERVKKPPLRILFVVLCSFLTIRYVFWRTTETLVYTGPADFMAMMALYLAEMYAITVHALGIFTNIWPLESKIMPLPADRSLYPSVDVFIPTYNEPPDIVKVTAMSALNIDYPKEKLKIFILDDGASAAKRNDPKTSAAAWERYYELKGLATRLGIGYIARERNIKAKAGNLNNALAHTDSDLILVLDCDHVPVRDILKHTAGWFLKDEKVAFVQTPHFFINPNPIEKNMAIFKDAPSENDMFYRAIHPGLDMWNSSYFCGSAAVLRRKYLEEIGGICGETITEDCETALSLHQRGYKSVYIPRPMVCGLSPDTFDDLIVQKSRWAQGMTQILVLRNPLFQKGLKFYQKLCYFNSCFYWFFGLTRVIFFIAPAAFLLLDLKVYFASVPQVLAYAIPHVLGSILLTGFLYGKFRWPFFSEFFEGIQSLFLIPAVLSVFFNPRKPSFKVTPKGKSLETEYLSSLALPFLLLTMVLIVSIPAAVMKWIQFPMYRDITMITLIWCVLNLLLALASFGAFFERKQVRRHHRMWAKGKARIFLPRLNMMAEVKIDDVSLSGLGLVFESSEQLAQHDHLILETRNSYGKRFKLPARVQRCVRKGNKYSCGCEFLPVGKAGYAEMVEFVYGDSQRWADFWEQKTKPANPVWVLLFLFKASVNGVKILYIATMKFIIHPALARLKRFFQHLTGRAKLPAGAAG
ncbi:MAG: UDP-forming cellulose synthase catalytic subunit [Elusimicrobiota bacterium]|nr:UDP-forming cellulose synthase catalytic subunit [Elusimicrobiota bacterium]